MTATLGELLERERETLRRFLSSHGQGLLRFESVEDLVQGVHLRALQGGAPFDYRGEEAFRAWLFAVARRHIADRHDHWTTLKRGSGRVFRLTSHGASSDPGTVPTPPGGGTGPATFASRREQLVMVARALDVLPGRDRELVQWMSEGVSLAEQAERLGVAQGAAQRAAHRAVERFRKAFRLVQQRRPD